MILNSVIIVSHVDQRYNIVFAQKFFRWKSTIIKGLLEAAMNERMK